MEISYFTIVNFVFILLKKPPVAFKNLVFPAAMIGYLFMKLNASLKESSTCHLNNMKTINNDLSVRKNLRDKSGILSIQIDYYTLDPLPFRERITVEKVISNRLGQAIRENSNNLVFILCVTTDE